MCKLIIRPFLFLFDPEKVHHFVIFLLKMIHVVPLKMRIIKSMLSFSHASLERKIWGLTFKNPIGLSAGFDKNAEVFNELAAFGFGFIEIGTVTPAAQLGHPGPRLFRLIKDKALINRMEFNSAGMEAVVKNLKKRSHECIIGGNIGKNTATDNSKAADDYLKVFETLYPYVDYFVVNVSCPNIQNLQVLQEKEQMKAIVRKLTDSRQRREKQKPILIKISPDLSLIQIDDILSIISEFKLDGIVAANTSTGRANLKTPADMLEKIGHGGLSGAPLKDASTGIIRYISQKTNGSVPIIASGGVMCPADALEKLQAGALLVQVYTGFIFEGPGLVKKILKEIQ
jgi:dihydroorotate dehydrogenase